MFVGQCEAKVVWPSAADQVATIIAVLTWRLAFKRGADCSKKKKRFYVFSSGCDNFNVASDFMLFERHSSLFSLANRLKGDSKLTGKLWLKVMWPPMSKRKPICNKRAIQPADRATSDRFFGRRLPPHLVGDRRRQAAGSRILRRPLDGGCWPPTATNLLKHRQLDVARLRVALFAQLVEAIGKAERRRRGADRDNAKNHAADEPKVES